MMKLSYLSSGDCSPMQAVIGSIAAQEVMKVRLRRIKLDDLA